MTTETRRRILQNIHAGKDPYDGFTGSQLGGAIRSAQLVLRADWLAVENGRLVLTKSGLAELEQR